MFPDADIETRMHDYTKSIFPHSSWDQVGSELLPRFKYRPLSPPSPFLSSSGTVARLADISFHSTIIVRRTSRVGRPPPIQFSNQHFLFPTTALSGLAYQHLLFLVLWTSTLIFFSSQSLSRTARAILRQESDALWPLTNHCLVSRATLTHYPSHPLFSRAQDGPSKILLPQYG